MSFNNLFLSLFLMLVFASTSAQTYPKSMVIGHDTVMCFTMEQTRELAARNETRKGVQIELGLCDMQIDTLEAIISRQDSVIHACIQIETKYKAVVFEYEGKNSRLKKDVSILQNDVRRQKRQKWAAIIGGSILSVIFAVLAFK